MIQIIHNAQKLWEAIEKSDSFPKLRYVANRNGQLYEVHVETKTKEELQLERIQNLTDRVCNLEEKLKVKK